MKGWLVAVAAVVLSAGARAESEIPLAISAYGLPFVTVTVNGHEARALVDTGSFHGIELSGRLAGVLALATEEMAGTAARRHQGAPIKFRAATVEFALGDMRVPRAAAEVADGDIENIARQVGTDFDVILGWGFLGAAPLTLDYARGVLRLGVAAGTGTEVPYNDAKRMPIVAGTLAGRPVDFLVDTGAPVSSLDPSIAGVPVGGEPVETAVLGGTPVRVGFRVKDLAVILRSLGCGAVLGNTVWGRGSIAFDPARRVVVIAP